MNMRHLLLLVAALLVLLGMLIASHYWQANPATDASHERKAKSLRVMSHPEADFDYEMELPGDPIGIAWNQKEFIIGNRVDPWGFLRIRPLEGSVFEAESVPLLDPVYHQKVSVNAITWNGKDYVGCTDGAWFQTKDKSVFTVHEPRTLRLVSHQPAPDLLGCLTWDGNGYWGATRRNTENSGEAAFLYRFDSNFQIVGKFDPPADGCQGLAWDGAYFWFADVFSDNIYLIRPDSDGIRVVRTYPSPFHYLSGIVYDGENIWIVEYDTKKLHRMSPKLRAQLVAPS